MTNRRAVRQIRRPIGSLSAIGDHDHVVDAFCGKLRSQDRDIERAVYGLSASHRHRIVVEQFVSDVDLGGDRLSDRQQAGMKVSTVTKISENVLGFGECRLPHPCHALATHVRKRCGIPIGHPGHHVVAADAGYRA